MADVDTDDAISALVRLDFGFFLQMAFHALGGESLYVHNWHIDAIIHQLDRVRTRENRHLIVTIPPRHLKSRIISIAWVAWRLGHDPGHSFMCVTYGQNLSEDHARDCLKIMQSRWYRRAFPSLVLTSRAVAHIRTSAGGGRIATSTEGSITGFGADTIIVDDPLKAQDALSAVARDANNRMFDDTLAQRPNNQMTGSVIVVMQRLHENDLAGHLKKQGSFHELCLPAIATRDEAIPLTRGRVYQRREGYALHPERQSLEWLEAKKAANPYVFAGQFQQNPIPEIGNIIETSWIGKFDLSNLDLTHGQIVMSLDTASKDNPFNDYSAVVVALVLGKSVYIVDVFRKRLKFPELEAKTIELARLHGAHVLLIEDAASGQQLIQRLRAEEPKGVPSPIARQPKGDKTSRVMAASALIQSGRLFVPETAHWVADYVGELCGFPSASYDDQVDATTQLLLWVQEKDMWYTPINTGPELMADGEDDCSSGRGDGSAWEWPEDKDPWGAY